MSHFNFSTLAFSVIFGSCEIDLLVALFDHNHQVFKARQNGPFLINFTSYIFSGRAGSEVDLKSVVKCFTALKFEVHIHRNLNYADIATLLDEMASDIDHSHSDCFVMFLLSHGNLGTIYAYDAPYPTQKLWEPFTANRAPTLTGKPKLFFIQVKNQSESLHLITVF